MPLSKIVTADTDSATRRVERVSHFTLTASLVDAESGSSSESAKAWPVRRAITGFGNSDAAPLPSPVLPAIAVLLILPELVLPLV